MVWRTTDTSRAIPRTPSSFSEETPPRFRSDLSSYSTGGRRGGRGGRAEPSGGRKGGGGKAGQGTGAVNGWTKRASAARADERGRGGKTAREDARGADGRGEGRQRLDRTGDGPAGGGKRREVHTEEEDEGASEEEGEGHKMDKILVLHAPYTNTLSAAFYDGESRKLSVLEDTRDSASWDLACLVMEQCMPDVVVVSSKYQDSLMDEVEKFVNANNITTKIEHQRSFTQQKGEEFLSRVRLPDLSCPITLEDDPAPSSRLSSGERGEARTRERSRSAASGPATTIVSGSYAAAGFGGEGAGMGKVRLGLVKMGCWVNVDAPLAVAAVGGLMNFLWKSARGSADAEGCLDMTVVEAMAINDHMLINRDVLQSLAILDFDGQTRVRNHNDPCQRSVLSLFNIYSHHVSTPMGRKLLHLWFLRPLLSLEGLAGRHNAVEALSDPENLAVLQDLKKHLRKIKNVVASVTKIRRGLGSVADWRGLIDALVALEQLQKDVGDIYTAHRLSVLEQVRDSMNEQLLAFIRQVVSIIDWDESMQQKRVSVQWGVNDELDQWRTTLAKMEPLLSKAARDLLESGAVPAEFCPEINVVSFPQIGYLVVCRPYAEQQPPEGWTYAFTSGDYTYYKTSEMLNLDDHFGDLDGMIQDVDREIEIVQHLTEALREVEGSILSSMDIIAELDCLIALASVVNEYSLVRPEMVEEPVLLIHEGRHILQEQCVSHYISNSTAMAGGDHPTYRSMFIVTGANGSGKSLYGKQVALIAYMAQIGSFVPALQATIGVCDKIYTRMQTRESVSKPASAFMIDLSQVSHALRGATERSLFILDEFGKGTTPADGAGLLAGVVDHLVQGPKPRTIVLTHFHELFANQFLPKSAPIIFCHMQTMMKEDANGLVFLYRMKAGLAKTSNAAECALLHGVPPAVVERGRQVTHALATSSLSALFSKPLSPLEILDLQEGEELCRRFLSWEIKADPDSDSNADAEDLLDALRDLVDGVEEEWADRKESAKRGEELQALVEEIQDEDWAGSVEASAEGPSATNGRDTLTGQTMERKGARAELLDSEDEVEGNMSLDQYDHLRMVHDGGSYETGAAPQVEREPVPSKDTLSLAMFNGHIETEEDADIKYIGTTGPMVRTQMNQGDSDDQTNEETQRAAAARQEMPLGVKKAEEEDVFWAQSDEARLAFWGATH